MENNSTHAVAGGGKVWSPPPPPTPTPPVSLQFYSSSTENPGKKSKLKYLLEEIADFMDPITVLVMMTVCFCLVMIVMSNHSASNRKEELNTVLQQEYGYSSVEVEDMNATVVTSTGEEKEVGVLTYQNATILFENPDQMNEKMSKVDAGTYPEVFTDLD